MLISELIDRGVIRRGDYPPFLYNAVHYLTIMGSIAYAVNDDTSDFDVYGMFVPPKAEIFPHTVGHILGFGKHPPVTKHWQKHHIFDKDAEGGKGRSYDFNLHSIVSYFQLCMDCNPNMIDSLFTSRRCILHTSSVGELMRENRHLFLHKGAWHRFKGYAYSQVHKMKSQSREGKRKELVEKFGYDVKFGYHVVRLMCEIEQILIEGTLDLERNKEQLKAIRRGEWTLDQIEQYFSDKEKHLEELYLKSELPKFPDEQKIKKVLIDCLQIVYDDTETILTQDSKDEAALAIREIADVLRKYRAI